jgi:Na+/proline symporter
MIDSSSFSLHPLSFQLLLALPFAGAVIGKLLARRNHGRGAALGLTIGLFGPLALILYLFYSWLSEAIGLSSLLNILACLAAAVLLGAGWGKIVRSSLSVNPWRKDEGGRMKDEKPSNE